jgi:hypothetical protein
MPRQLRQLFVVICKERKALNIRELYEKHKRAMYDDFMYQYPQYDEIVWENLLLNAFHRLFQHDSIDMSKDFNLCMPDEQVLIDLQQAETQSPFNFSRFTIAEHRVKAEAMCSTFTAEQQVAFDTVIQAIENYEKNENGEQNQCNHYFCEGFAGVGKTFLFNVCFFFFI